MRTISAILVALLVTAPGLRAQDVAGDTGESGPQLVDRVAAVVGDSAILYTEIEEQMLQLRAMGQELPEDPAQQRQLRREILRNLVDEELLTHGALRDSIRIPPQEIENALEEDFQQRIQAFGSEAALRRQLQAEGLTVDRYREILRRDIRRTALIQRYVESQVQQRSQPPVDSAELRRLYESRKGSFGERPATVDFEQVVVPARASDPVKAKAREEAERILGEIREGEEFAALARRHSDDPGSRQQGGDLGWFRRGVMVKPFEDAAFALRPGEVSDVVETEFGFHIIKVERVRSGERKVRHILIQPEVDETAQDRARQRAIDVLERARAGESLAAIGEEINAPAEPPVVGPVPRNQLPGPYAEALSDAGEGDLVGPIRIEQGQSPVRFAVIRVTDVRGQGEYTFEDVRDQLADQLRRQKIVEQVLEELRRSTYVSVRI